MWRFSANLSMLFIERPFLERFAAAAAAGFRHVEFAYPYDHDPHDLRERLVESGLLPVMFNLPPGNRATGERGLAAIPGREEAFDEAIERGVAYAGALGVDRVMCLVGVAAPGVDRRRYREIAVERLRVAARRLADEGLVLLIEPFNPHDVPGYLVPSSTEALSLIDAVNEPNIMLQFDLYHAQRSEGGLIDTIRANLDRIGHIQIADSPDRGPPGSGELCIPNVLQELTRLGYRGYVGLEYHPLGPTEASFGWMGPFRDRLGRR